MDYTILNGISVLYVEDDINILNSTTQTLELFSTKPTTALNGQEGLELFKKNSYDLIITDIKMDKLDGLSMSRQIRETNKDIPIIITTAHQDNEFLHQAIELNISSYVTKPIDIYKLRDAMVKAIEPIFLKNQLYLKNESLQNEIIKNQEQHELLIKQSRFAAMGELLNMIAHQWRQPLAAIGTASFFLKHKINLSEINFNENEKTKELKVLLDKKLDDIEFYVQTLTNTINDFRNFYKKDKEIKKQRLSISLENTLNILSGNIKEENIKIEKNIQFDEEIEIYSNEIIHVFLNIIKNSIDVFKEKRVLSPKISIFLYKKDEEVYIQILDNAGGINEEIKDEIFDPYFSTKSKKNGTGLGLYMSKIIIEKNHEGKIFAENFQKGLRTTIILKNT